MALMFSSLGKWLFYAEDKFVVDIKHQSTDQLSRFESLSTILLCTSVALMAPKRKTKSDTAAEEVAKSSTKKQKSAKLEVGSNACDVLDVTFLREDDSKTTLKDLVKDNGIVIFMYPRANTPGCTKQACGFRDHHEEITKHGFQVYGLSYDKPKSQKNWKTKYDLPYHLLTDEQGVAIKAFGASKAPKGIIRSHVVIEKGGKVLDIQNKISPADSYTSALETILEADA